MEEDQGSPHPGDSFLLFPIFEVPGVNGLVHSSFESI